MTDLSDFGQVTQHNLSLPICKVGTAIRTLAILGLLPGLCETLPDLAHVIKEDSF